MALLSSWHVFFTKDSFFPLHSFLYHYLCLTSASDITGRIVATHKALKLLHSIVSVFKFMFLLNMMAVVVREWDISFKSPISIVFQKICSPMILTLPLSRQFLCVFPTSHPLSKLHARSPAQPATPPCAQSPAQMHILSCLFSSAPHPSTKFLLGPLWQEFRSVPCPHPITSPPQDLT